MQNKQNNILAIISVVFAAVIGGGIPVFAKIGLKVVPPFTFTFLRFFIASLFLMPVFLKNNPKIDKNIWRIILLSLLASANVTLFAFGVRFTTATISQILYAIVPVIAVILSYFILKEKITKRKTIGIIIGLMGVMVIIILPVTGNNLAFAGNLLGNFIIFTAVLCFSAYSVLSKKFQNTHSPVFLTSMFAFTTTIILSFFSAYEFISNSSWINQLSVEVILSILYIGIGGGVLYYLLYQYAIKHGNPVVASMTMFIQPVATFCWAFFLLSERLTVGVISGGLLALLGASIVSLRKK